jgi:ATP-dependent RNA helicase DDX27
VRGANKKQKKGKKNKKKQLEEEASSGNDGVAKIEFEDAPLDLAQSTSFHSMNLSRPLMRAIEAMNFVHPTPIQSATVPLALAGRDVCGCAATGTGKTAAYMLPVLERLLFRPKGRSVTRVLVLVPTRELGVQVYQVRYFFE